MLLIWKFYVDVIDSGNYICWIGEMFWIWEVNVFLGKVLKKRLFWIFVLVYYDFL